MEITFIIPGAPFAKERAGRRIMKTKEGKSFVHSYNPGATARQEKLIADRAREVWHTRPLLDGVPLSLRVICCLAVPASWSGRKRADAHGGVIMPMGRPDWDNYAKLVSDALNGVIYRDDAMICTAHVSKLYAPVERTEITVWWPQKPEQPELQRKMLLDA
jgi:Holliday junction resolvase RusA-like endonuclease